jgi:hypothetical protein
MFIPAVLNILVLTAQLGYSFICGTLELEYRTKIYNTITPILK